MFVVTLAINSKENILAQYIIVLSEIMTNVVAK